MATTRGRSRPSVGRDAERPTDIPARGWKDVLRRVVHELKEDHVSLLSAGVAFKALLAIFPAAIAGISVWALVADPATITEQVTRFTQALPASASDVIERQLTDVASTSSGALSWTVAVSIVLALWSASAGVAGLMEGCNAAYDEVDERSFPRKRGLALLLTVGAIVFLLVTLGVIVAVPALLDQVGLGRVGELAVRIGQWPVLALLVLGALAIMYRYGPDRDAPRIRWVTPGALLAMVVWLLASAGLTIYVERIGDLAATYGALAGVIVLMLWLYLSAFAVLLGAEVNAETERQTVRDTTVGSPAPMGRRGAVAADTLPDGHDGRR